MSTFGFIAPEDIWSARSEQYFNQVLAGIEDAVAGAGHTVITRAVGSREQEMAVYREWAERGTVRAVVLRDLVPDDPRPALLAELGLLHVLEGDVVQEGDAPSVAVDNAAVMRGVLDALHARGHRRIAHLGGPPGLVHSALRREAYLAWCREHGAAALVAQGDYTGDSGARALDTLLAADAAGVDVLLADNDAMALAASTCLAPSRSSPGTTPWPASCTSRRSPRSAPHRARPAPPWAGRSPPSSRSRRRSSTSCGRSPCCSSGRRSPRPPAPVPWTPAPPVGSRA